MMRLRLFSKCARSVSTKRFKNEILPAAARLKHVDSSSSVSSMGSYSEGEYGSTEFRLYATKEGQTVGWWHSIPFVTASNGLNFVCEIPKGTTAKMEVNTKEAGNPIAQDVKKGAPRHYGIKAAFNYGCIPQTYENPEEVDPNVDIRALGDGDPLDAVELSDEPIEMGTLGEVIPVGVLCLIDEGEVDWKLFVLRADHPLVEKKRREKEVSRGGHRTSSTSPSTFNAPYLTLDDVEEHFPGKMSAIREWFRTYKTFEGKDENKFGLNEEIKDGEFAWKVIFQCHHEWRDLVGGNNPRNLPIPGDLLLL
eukprot:CAMPEP_0113902660 /NCGR_PEP_ID=MMETSP0780_2-20120614/21976_1 /TAXON_ID=652834 /ORGANISM="Palpitomonas bilix" /LENGTH=307 /DNA_ID=CAMNT_0000895495 /DNA_START=121 /DNA_END=1044 /DNA_ORIENTATION=- /assembly_acc=CAM_ASM_000599